MKTKERARIAELKLKIAKHFGEVGSEEPHFTSPRTTDLTEMLQVLTVQKGAVTLIHLFEDETFEAVEFPVEIRNLLKKGDTFLMSIAKRKQGWQVIDMSPPYTDCRI